MSVPAAVPLRRDPERGIIGGVAAGLGRRLRIDPIIVRVLFVAMTMVGGAGLAGYLLGWALMPADGSARSPVERIVARRDTWLVVAGVGCLALAGLLLLRALGPVVQRRDRVAGRARRRRRRADLAPVDRCAPERGPPAPRSARAPPLPALRLPATRSAARRSGPRWSSAAALVFLWLNDALRAGARRAARRRRGRGRAGADPRAVVAAARARAERRARRADPLAGARRGRRAPARLGAADAGADAEARRRPARGGRARPPPGARAARVAERRAREPARADCRRARWRRPRPRSRRRPRRADRGRRGRRRAARRRAPRRSSPPRARRWSTPRSSLGGTAGRAVRRGGAPSAIEVFVRDRGPGFDPDRVPGRPPRRARVDRRPDGAPRRPRRRCTPRPARAPRSSW